MNIPPDFHSIPAQVRINAATILREDSLYRKQQAKDVQLLKQYEWELKDSSEYYTWQQEMKERDQHEKLLLVNLRRQQAKSSAIDAKEALNKQKEDNLLIGNILREQSNEIKLQKQLENEINLLINQENVIKISHERELKPKEAKKIILEKKIENTKKLKNELQEKLHEKELNDILEEEIRADKIRQLKALNSVHHEVIKVFDPTEIAGVGVMNEMSYMEMKERLEINKNYEKIQIENKKDEILEEKEKKAAKLHKKSLLILQARERRAQATALYHQKIQEKKLKLLEEENFIKIENSIKLHHELQEKREIKLNEKEKLQLEAERIKRKQQYLGQAMGRVDEIRNEEILKSEERKILKQQNELKEEIKLKELTQLKNLNNKEKLQKNEKKLKRNALQEAEITALRERKIAMEKLKEEYQQKKEKVHEGHQHHQKVKEIIKENNRYADRITQESLERARNSTNTSRAKTS